MFPSTATRYWPPLGSFAHDQRRLTLWIGLACLVLWGALAAPFFAGQVYLADDLGEFHLPARAFYAQQLREGSGYDWMPGLYSGFFLTGEGQAGTYHPWHWLLYRYLPLAAAFDLEVSLSYVVLLAGCFRLFDRHLADHAAALFGALAFTFSGFCLLHFVHTNAIAVVAHLPWLLLALEGSLAAATGRAAAICNVLVSAIVASQLLLGYPQYVWFSLLAAGPYALWRRAEHRASWVRMAAIGGSLVCGALVAGVQLVPTAEALAESTRGTADATFANSGALHPLNLVQLVAPYLLETRVVGQNTHELGLYVGAVPLALCIWLLGQRPRLGPLRPLALAAAVLGIAALLLAMGDSGGLYRIQQWIPLANRFRFPCRAIVLVQLAAAIGAAIAMKLLLAPHRPTPAELGPSRRLLRLLAIAALATALVGGLAWQSYAAAPWLVAAGPALVISAAWLVDRAALGARWARLALVIVAAADLGAYGLSYAVYRKSAPLAGAAADLALPPHPAPGRVSTWSAQTDGPRVGNRMLLAGLRRADGYAGLEPARRLDYRRVSTLQTAGVRWVLAEPGSEPWPGLKPADPRWWEVPEPLPRFRLASQTVVDFDPSALADPRVAAVEEPVLLPPSTPGAVAAIVDQPGKIDLSVHAPARQLLVVAESFHRGWRADVDGQPVPVLRVNGDFLGCVVEGGNRLVRLRFAPRSVATGRMLSGCGLGLMLCLLAASLRHLPDAEPSS